MIRKKLNTEFNKKLDELNEKISKITVELKKKLRILNLIQLIK